MRIRVSVGGSYSSEPQEVKRALLEAAEHPQVLKNPEPSVQFIDFQAGFPQETFRTLLVGSQQVEAIIENQLVKAVTLTGSTPAGRAVAKKEPVKCLRKLCWRSVGATLM